MARFVAIGEMPNLTETAFREALDRHKKWRFDRQSWVIKAYMSPDDGKLIVECETPEQSRFEEWLKKNGWPYSEIHRVKLIHEGGTVWPV